MDHQQDGTPSHPAVIKILALCKTHLDNIVDVQCYEYTSCYLWHDRPLYNNFGEQIRQLNGDTIYLYEKSTSPATDLLHELGHMVGRKFNMVGHIENGYQGIWESQNARLIAEVCGHNHWSDYLKEFALAQEGFAANAASELWAELFMLWHLYPQSPEAQLLKTTMNKLETTATCQSIATLAAKLRIATQPNQQF